MSGSTLAHAIRELRHRQPRHIFFGRLQAVVVGEAAARRGMRHILEFVWRSQEVRPAIDLLLARAEAGAVVAARPALEYMPGRGLFHLMERVSGHSTAPRVPLSRMMYTILQPGLATALPLIEIGETGAPDPGAAPSILDPMIIGVGIFNRDVLVRTLDQTESLGMMWARGEVRRTTLTFPDPGRGGEQVRVEIKRAGLLR